MLVSMVFSRTALAETLPSGVGGNHVQVVLTLVQLDRYFPGAALPILATLPKATEPSAPPYSCTVPPVSPSTLPDSTTELPLDLVASIASEDSAIVVSMVRLSLA